MEKIKYVHRQDCGFKLSAGNSGETSLNLSNEIFDLIAKGTMQLGQEREVSFKIYKEDCIKAICFIVLKLPLYQSSSNSSVKITDGMATFQKLLAKVNSIFGDDDCVDYIVNLYYRTDGRIYLNRLKVNDFSIRDVLVENNSAILFKEETDGKIAIRILSNIQDREEANNETPNYKEYLRIKSAATFLKEALLITKRKDPNLVNLEKLNKYRKTDKQLLIANYKLGRNKNYLPARLSDVALDVEWQYDGIDYVLDLELVPRDMEMLFFPAYNEAYQGIFQMKKDANEEYVLYEIISDSDKLDEPNQQIYYGAPGTGKSHEVKKQTGEWISDEEEQDLPNVFRTTFHPDTDYASFVGCYKPTMKPTSKEEKTLTGKDEEIVYEYVPQVFTDAYVYAYANPNQDTFLVIEEINRGNCAQIFGDLFQLLDRKDGKSEYKIKADKDLAKYLSEAKDKDGQDILKDKEGIKDGKLCLPANLHILATMNTSDQSLFPMDSAFKRRWEWEYVPINYGTEVQSGEFEITIGEKKYPWVKFIEKVNEKIFALTQSEDKQMGNFFIKHSIDDKGFKSKVMFYLWYEVLRDETENNKYFFYGKTTIDGKEVLSKFTFKDLYTDKATETLQQFMEYLGVASK